MPPPVDLPICKHCGESHGPTACRAELALVLADERAEHADDHQRLATLTLEVAALRWKLDQAEMPRYGRPT